MDKSEIIAFVNQYVYNVVSMLHPDMIVLYGSYAKGSATKESDIDIAVVYNNFTGDFLETARLLYKLRRDIDDRIEPVLLDIKSDKSGFVNEILKTGYVLYTQ